MNVTPSKLFKTFTNRETSNDQKNNWFQLQSAQGQLHSHQGKSPFKQIHDEDTKPSRNIFQTFSRINELNLDTHKDKEKSKNIKIELEAMYQDRITQLNQMNQFRLETLWEQVQATLKQVLEDELIDTMKQEPTTQEFVWHRIAELFDEVFHGEREKLFEKVTEQYSLLKSDYHTQQRQVQQLQSTVTQLENQLLTQNQSLNKELEQQRSESDLLKQSYNEKQNQSLRESVNKYKELNQELQCKLDQSHQQCLLIQQSNDHFKQALGEASNTITIRESSLFNAQMKFKEQLSIIKQQFEQRLCGIEELTYKQQSTLKIKLESLQCIIVSLRRKHQHFIQTHHNKNKRLKSSIEQDYDAQTTRLTRDLEKLKDKTVKLKEKCSTLKCALEQANQLGQAHENTVHSLQRKLTIVERERNELSESVQGVLHDENQKALVLLNRREQEVHKLTEELQQKNHQLVILSQDSRDAEQLSAQRTSTLQEEMQIQKSKIESLQKQLNNNEESLVTKQKEIEKLKSLETILRSGQTQENELSNQVYQLRRMLSESEQRNEQIKQNTEQQLKASKERELQLKNRYQEMVQELSTQETTTKQQSKQLLSQITQIETQLQTIKTIQQNNIGLQQDLDNERQEKNISSNQEELNQYRDQVEQYEQQIEEFQQLVYQQQTVLQEQKGQYESQHSQDMGEISQLAGDYKRELFQVQEYCQELCAQNKEMIKQLHDAKQEMQTAQESKERVLKRCKDKMKRVKYILNEQKAQAIFELTKMKREVFALRQFVNGCLQSEKAQVKMILSAFESQVKGVWNQQKLHFQNQQIVLRNSLTENYEHSAVMARDQHHQEQQELNNTCQQKIRSLGSQIEEHQKEMQQLITLIEKSEESIMALQQQIEKLCSENEQLEKMLGEKGDQFQWAQQENDELVQSLKRIEGTLNRLISERSKSKDHYLNLIKQLHGLRDVQNEFQDRNQKDFFNAREKVEESFNDAKLEMELELEQVRQAFETQTKYAESCSLRLKEAEQEIVHLEKEMKSVQELVSFTKFSSKTDNHEIRSRDLTILQLNKQIEKNMEESDKMAQENSKLKKTLQKMTDSFENKEVESQRENQELFSIQQNLQDEIKGLYKVISHNVPEKDGFNHQKQMPGSTMDRDLQQRLKQLKDLSTGLGDKTRKKQHGTASFNRRPQLDSLQ